MFNLLRPKAIHLVLFCVVLAPIAYFFIADTLLSLFSMSGIYELFIYLAIFLVATLIVDFAFKTKVVRYGIVAVILVIAMVVVSIPVSENKETKTEKLGFKLADKIEEYKKTYGHFPENLNDNFFKDAPKNTALGHSFQYRIYVNEKGKEYFELKFFGRDGMDAYLYSTKKEWRYVD